MKTKRIIASALISAAVIFLLALMVLAQKGKKLAAYAKLMKADVETGETAPDFILTSEDKKKTVTLSELYAKKPVALIFGSYT